MTVPSIGSNEEIALEEACDVLARGGLIALPTETVYGLAADATKGEAVARIFEAKGRPHFNPLICHISSAAMARRYVQFDDLALHLAETFWPGPLTLVLPAVENTAVQALTRVGLDTLAVRMPSGFAQRLIERYDRPLAAPSANTSGRISATRAEHVASDLGDRVDLILDGGAAEIGLESTILKPHSGGIELLRPGGLAVEMIENETGLEVARRQSGVAAIEAPGMLQSHYAPRKALRIDSDRVFEGDAVITFAGHKLRDHQKAVVTLDLSPTGDLREAAANLFDHLQRVDASAATTIAVASVPKTGLGEAINDRLARAAAPAEEQEPPRP